MIYKVYYDDGTVEDDQISQPWRVVCIAQVRERTGREVVHAYPYYILTNNVWRGLDDATSLIQQLMYHLPEITKVAMGVWVDEESFKAIYHRAKYEDGLPPRSAEDGANRRR